MAAAAGLLALRTLSGRIRLAFDVVCLAALSVVLHRRGATPILASSGPAPDSATLWLRLLVVAWWLVSARLLVAVLYFTLRHDRGHRSAKLVVDLTAAAIYVGAALIVLNSVLAIPVGDLVATSGVVAIVLGLALQSTLADVFSGIAVGIEAPFKRLQPMQLEDLARRLTTRLLEPGEVLFAEEAADATLYVVASGVLEITRAAGTTASLTLGRIGAGEYIGELGLLTGSPHGATARARTHCVVYQLRRDAIAGLLETNADVAAALERSVRRGLELVSRKVAAIATGDVGVRGQLLQRIRRFFRSDAA